MVMKVGMQDLDKALARIVDRARIEPVQVLRYARPWVWIVGNDLWERPAAVVSFVPERHPLRAMRTHVDATLAGDIADLFQIGKALRLDMAVEIVMRSLVLQLLYSLRDEQELAERIGYDLTHRWFVGLELDQPVPEPHALSAALMRVRSQEAAVMTLQRLMYEVVPPHLAEAGDAFSPDYGLLSQWMAPFLSLPKEVSAPPLDLA